MFLGLIHDLNHSLALASTKVELTGLIADGRVRHLPGDSSPIRLVHVVNAFA